MSGLKLVQGVRVASAGTSPVTGMSAVMVTQDLAAARRPAPVVFGRGPAGPPGPAGDAATQTMLTAADQKLAAVDEKLAEADQVLADTAQSAAAMDAATAETLGMLGVQPQYISDTNADPPAAPDGSYGARWAPGNLWQRLKRVAGAWQPSGSPVVSLAAAQGRQNYIRVDDYILPGETNHNAAVQRAQDAATLRRGDPGAVGLQFTAGREYYLHEFPWDPWYSWIGGDGRMSSVRIVYDGAGGAGSALLKPISGAAYSKIVGIDLVGNNYDWNGAHGTADCDYLIDFGTKGPDMGFGLPNSQLTGWTKAAIRCGYITNLFLRDFRTDRGKGPLLDITPTDNMENRPVVLTDFTIDTYRYDGSPRSGSGLAVIRNGGKGIRLIVKNVRYEGNLPPLRDADNPQGALVSVLGSRASGNAITIDFDGLVGYQTTIKNENRVSCPLVAFEDPQNSRVSWRNSTMSVSTTPVAVMKQDGTVLSRNSAGSSGRWSSFGEFNTQDDGALGDKIEARGTGLPTATAAGRWASGDVIHIQPVLADGTYAAICTSPSGGYYCHKNGSRPAYPFSIAAGSTTMSTANAWQLVAGDMITLPGAGAAGGDLNTRVQSVNYDAATVTLRDAAGTAVPAGANWLYQVPTWEAIKLPSKAGAGNVVTTDTAQTISAVKTFTAVQDMRSGINLKGTGIIYISDSTDPNHILRFAATGKEFAGAALNGPVLAGYNGGALGTKQANLNREQIMVQWDWNKLGFFGTAPVARPVVSSTQLTVSNPPTQAEVQAIETRQRDIITALKTLGLLG